MNNDQNEMLPYAQWNGSQTDYPKEKCMHELFELQVERAPEAVAVVFGDQSLTYQELNRRANKLAHYLQRQGVGPDVLVGLHVERSLEMVIGLLGVLKAGGAYVPLDPSYPAERLAFMLEDTQSPVILTQQQLVGTLPAHTATVFVLDSDWRTLAQEQEENVVSGVQPTHLAYIIYTSGSTGKPKGVMIPHQGLVNYLSWCTQAYTVAEGQGTLVHSPLGFDLTITSLLSPLIVGQKAVLVSEGVGVEELHAALHSGTDFSLVKITPAHLKLLSQVLSSEDAGRAKVLVIGGEALRGEDIAFWRTHAPSTRLINEYGPTETVVGCSIYEVSADTPSSGPISIGLPIANTQLYILDEHLQPVSMGVEGELYIGGDGVARGYLNRPDLTSERFIPDPFNSNPNARLYKTGDVARYGTDGNIEFLGRLDEQVKVRGFRIELGEIESLLELHPAVRKAVVVTREDASGERGLAGYVILHEKNSITGPELQSHVMKHAPSYMVPTVAMLDAFPLTPNGKVDRRSLSQLEYEQPTTTEHKDEPRTPLEETVARIWSQALGIESIGIHDDFFMLGGHSLLAMQVISNLRAALHVELPLLSFFEADTVAQQAEYICQLQAAENAPTLLPSIEAAPRASYHRSVSSLPATSSEERDDNEITILPSSTQQEASLEHLKNTQKRSCFIIGEGSLLIQCAIILMDNEFSIYGVVSPDKKVHEWTKQHNISCIDPKSEDIVTFLSQKPFDYLFSIVNSVVLPKQILKLPRVDSINYHNAPLPRYAGSYVTSWAIMQGEEEHGITWHEMVDLVDAGKILKQCFIKIDDNDTAFSLNTKCYDAALRSFAELVEDIVSGSVSAKEQNMNERTFYPLYKRPSSGGVLDWGLATREICAFVRGLNFGPYDNPLGLPKLAVGKSFVIVPEIEAADLSSTNPSGTITQIGPSFMRVATKDGEVVLSKLLTIDGQPLPLSDFVQQFELYEGYRFEELDPVLATRITTYNSLVCKHETFWIQHLSTLEKVTMAYAHRNVSSVHNEQHISASMSISQEVINSLDCDKTWHAENFLLTAFVTYLARLSNTWSFDFGYRDAELKLELADMEGMFETYGLLHIDMEPHQTFEKIFHSVDEQVKQTKKRKTYARDITARFQRLSVKAQLQGAYQPSIFIERVETLDRYQASENTELALVIPDGGRECLWVYNPEILSMESIEKMQQEFATFLRGSVANFDKPVLSLPLLTEKESQQLLVEWNESQTDYPRDACIHELFETQVERTPEAIAVVFEDEVLTYQELNRRANQLAHYLQQQGVGPDVLVGLYVERSLEMVVGLLGILKAGGAYVPLDPAFPSDRLAFMLEDAKMPVMVTQQRLLTHLPAHSAKVVLLDGDAAVLAGQRESNLVSGAIATNLAYVIYTSGSTGRPKGVQIVHRAVVNLLLSMRQQPGLLEEDTLLAVTTLSFDIAVLELFLPLIVGARVIVTRRETVVDGMLLAKILVQESVTVMQATPNTWRLLLAAGWQGKPDLKILCGGEALPQDLIQQLLPRVASLWNMYGPTETTVWSTTCKVDSMEGVVTIGRPIANTQIYILDPQSQPVPIGVPGELYIGGDGLARGYLNRPELTSERFIPHPFSNESGARLYKTGDLARFRADGTIEHLGRLDFQIKLRGFRIELGEIEAMLAQHPSVRQAVVVAQDDGLGGKRLVACVIPNEKQSLIVRDLHHFLQKQLPNYMVPSAFILLDEFPQTPNGKIDRRVLEALEPELSEQDENYVAPETPIEKTLTGIWMQVLGLKRVGIHDNFFDLGGHSLLATQIISILRTTLHVEVPLLNFFEAGTIAQQAEYISQLQSAENMPSLLPSIESISRGFYRRSTSASQVGEAEKGPGEVALMPVSLQQQGLWLIDQLESHAPTYNSPILLQVHVHLDMVAFGQSLQALVQRHESLRTTFSLIEDQPMQVIAPTMHVPLKIVELREQAAEQQGAELKHLLANEMQQPFDLVHGPLLRVVVVHTSADSSLILLTTHHIISDGWSSGILAKELSVLYEAFSKSLPSPLPTLPIQYADFAYWQRNLLQGELITEHLAYWKQQLATRPEQLSLPADHPRSPMLPAKGALYQTVLPERLVSALKALSQQEGVTLYMTLVAAFQTLLARYSGQEDIIIGTTSAGRMQENIEPLIGYFANTLVLRTDLAGNPTFKELQQRVRKVVLEAHQHQMVSFEALVKELQPERQIGQNPIFQVMLTLNPAFPDLARGWMVEAKTVESEFSKFDLTLALSESSKELIANFEYRTDLFDESTIARMASNWQTLLESIIVEPTQQVNKLRLLSAEEEHRLLKEWNATQADYPQQCVHELFEAQAQQTPNAVAVVYEDQQLTYQQLNEQANQLAYHLIERGVGPDVLVGLCLEPSVEMIVAIFAVLKAGGAYVPLDAASPQERLMFVLQDSQAVVLITQQSLLDRLPTLQIPVVCLDGDNQVISQYSSANPPSRATNRNLAYVIYTSGSTGQPKGVLIEHRSLVDYCGTLKHKFGLSSVDNVLLFFAYTFDASVEQIFPTLTVGARLVLRGKEVWSPAQLLEKMKAYQLTMAALPTAYLHQVLQEWVRHPQQLQGLPLRLVLVGGDRFSPNMVQLWRQTPLSSLRLLNMYGPTESTVATTSYDLKYKQESEQEVERIPIGRPIPNRTIYILDSVGNPVPIGVVGELYIGGVGLAREYLNRPELTAKHFIDDPFSSVLGARLYRTGDLARYKADGNVEFLGRGDDQVKIRGYRIELGEIETALRGHPAVKQAVVVVREDIPGNKQLVAYVILDGQKSVTLKDVRQYMAKTVPSYMVPSAFMALEKFPLTTSDKVDRRALPAPDLSANVEDETFVAPEHMLHFQLIAIWEEILNVPSIGIKDNFFELGGNSLLAVRLLDRIEQVFHQRLQPTTLFVNPTIEGLAQVLQKDVGNDIQLPVIAVQRGEAKRPFFFLHGQWNGEGYYCYTFAKGLGKDQPFYAIPPFLLNDKHVVPTLEEVATSHIEALQSVQPEGPYALSGWCNGALVAYEMARQLQAQGQVVDSLILLNPVDLTPPKRLKSASKFIRQMGKLLHLDSGKQLYCFLRINHVSCYLIYPDYSERTEVKQLKERVQAKWAKWGRIGKLLSQLEFLVPPIEALYAPQPIFAWIAANYTPVGQYHGKTVFMWHRDELTDLGSWRHTVEDTKVEEYFLPGTHDTFLNTHLPNVIEQVRSSLDKANDGNREVAGDEAILV